MNAAFDKIEKSWLKLVLVTMSSLAIGCSQEFPQVVEAVVHVEGMTCGSCEQAIRDELLRLKGVHGVRASHVDGKVWVRYSPKVLSVEVIAAAISKLGFKASPDKRKR